MAEQAQAVLAGRDDRPPAGRIAGRAGERGRDRVADDRERAQLRLRRVRAEAAARPAAIAKRTRTVLAEDLGGDGLEPGLGIGRPRARGTRRGASSGLTPPAPSTSARTPVRRPVHAGDRDAVVGRDEAVAGVDELRLGRRPRPRSSAATAAAQTLAWALAEKADFGMAPAIAASPITWMPGCSRDSKVTGSIGHQPVAVGDAGGLRRCGRPAAAG